MTSVQTSLKQVPTNSGYYITLADASGKSYVNTGTDAAPTMVVVSDQNLGVGGATRAAAVRAVLRDEGKTLRSAGRIFRKVQLLQSTNTVVNGGTDGVSGYAATTAIVGPYYTYYIELPGSGVAPTDVTPVARLG